MDYICLKACRLCGRNYIKGDTIPGEAVERSRESALKDMGYIADGLETQVSDAPETASESISVTLIGKKGEADEELELSAAGVNNVITALQLTAEEAAECVNYMNSAAELRLLDRLDQRKTVKTAVAARLEGVYA